MLGFGPISETPIGDLHQWRTRVAATSALSATESATRIYAATYPFITRAADQPTNQPFDGTLEGSLRLDRSIAGSGDYGGYAKSISELSLINADGLYDNLAAAISINGQQITCSIGDITSINTIDTYTQFVRVANLVGERFTVSRSHVTIEMRDPGLTLTTETVQQGVYLGTGALEGGAEISGKRKPFGDGIVFNATPTLVIASELLWQINDGAVASIDAVKDGGVNLSFQADWPTVAQLRANVPALGFYSTCIAQGYFLLGGINFKQITCDFTGLRLTTADIIHNIATTVAGLTASNIDQSSFDNINAVQPASVGYFLDSGSSETCADMFTKLMTGIGGWHGMTALGVHYIKRFEAPDSLTSFYYDSTGDGILDIDRTALPQAVDPPPHRRRAIYQRNWTVMTDLFPGVSETDPALADQLTKPYLLASTGDAEGNVILGHFPDAPDPNPIESYFANEVDAMAEAERMFDLYTSGFQAYSLKLKNALFLHEIGDVINVNDSRLGLSSGKFLRLVSLSDDCTSMSTDAIGFG